MNTVTILSRQYIFLLGVAVSVGYKYYSAICWLLNKLFVFYLGCYNELFWRAPMK